MVSNFKRTNHRVKKGIQRLSGTKTNDSMGYEEGGSALNAGVREAKLKKINLKKLAENGWHVIMDNGRQVKVKMSSDLGLESLPTGTVKKGYLYPDDETTVKLVADSSGKVNHVVSTQLKNKETSTEVGATRITRGDSAVSVGQDNAFISVKNNTESKILATENSISFNSKTIILNGVEFDMEELIVFLTDALN